ncbi:MAG: pilin [Patescibacteria group bacterium]|nr:pilin [Patescibacteria group bacterium]
MIKINKYFFSGLLVFLFLISGFIDVNAAALVTDLKSQLSPIEEGQTSKFIEASGFSLGNTVEVTISTVIKIFLGFLGIIFIVLILYAGFNWMTARGDEEKVKKAQETIQKAVIGLIIIVSAYAITYFVFTNLPGGGSGGGVGGTGGGVTDSNPQ